MKKIQSLKIIVCIYLLLVLIPLTGAFFMKEAHTLEEQVLLNLIAQIDRNSEDEALKAQAILIRTNLTLHPKESEANMSRLKAFLKEDATGKSYERFQQAVKDTEGIVVKVDGKLKELPYHKVSCGSTRAAGEITDASADYLMSVSCPEDILAKDYLQVFYFSREELGEEVEIVSRFDSGYVEKVKISLPEADRENRDETQERANTLILTGEQFRKKYSLPSACFYVDEVKNKIRIVTKGRGHGLGLSQNKANVLAKEGKNAEEILAYFFKNIKLCQNEE